MALTKVLQINTQITDAGACPWGEGSPGGCCPRDTPIFLSVFMSRGDDRNGRNGPVLGGISPSASQPGSR